MMKSVNQALRYAQACTIALLWSSPAWAGDSQLWTGGSATIRLSDRWNLSQDVTARFSDKRGGLYEIEANTLVGFQLTRTLSLSAGYDHDPQYSDGRRTVMEHRFVQNLVSNDLGKFAGGQLSGRVRFEQRWREGLPGTGWRVRPYVRYAKPLCRDTKTALVLSGEPFFDLNTNSFQAARGLERLRTFVGISTPIAKNVSADIGYLNQHGFVPNGKDTSDNVGFVTLGLKL